METKKHIECDISRVEHELTENEEQLASREIQLSDLERQLRQDNLQVFCTANNLSLLNTSNGKLRTLVSMGFCTQICMDQNKI